MNKFDYIAIAGKAAAFIASLEGMALQPYCDVAGVSTVCYGKTGSMAKTGHTTGECDAALIGDTTDIVLKLAGLPFATDEQIIAITSFVYNIGFTAFNRSSVKKYLLKKEYNSAIQTIKKYVYVYTQQGKYRVKGLVNRRAKEYDMFYKGFERWR